jgi:mannose-6-phosphate isomerase-like protein (cupin superfamily)
LDKTQPAGESLIPRLLATASEARLASIEPGHLSALLMRHGSMQLRWYAPVGEDHQVPHDRDELYVVVSGTAVFVRAADTLPFAAEDTIDLDAPERTAVTLGDAVFVPAGTVHRFDEMSGDFAAWMIFYGPEGGEAAKMPEATPLPPNGADPTEW